MKSIILTVSNDLNYDQRMQKICNSLSNNGFNVVLIGFEKKNSKPLTSCNYMQVRLPLLFQKGKLFYIEMTIRLFFKVLVSKVDIISAVDMDTIIPCWLVTILRRKKLVFDAHEYFSETSGLVGRPFEKSIWQNLESFIIPKIDHAYTVGLSLANIFEENFKIKFRVIRNVPVLREFDSNLDGQGDFYLYQGALNKGRGLEILIEVFASNSLKLKIAGDGPLKEYLSAKINLYQMGDRVELLGWIAPIELQRLTAKAKGGFNLIDHHGLSYYLSLANKFFDYIHAGIPQICMDYPEYQRICHEHPVAILIGELSKRDIQYALDLIENDNEYYLRLQKACLEARQIFNWQEEKELLNIYSQFN